MISRRQAVFNGIPLPQRTESIHDKMWKKEKETIQLIKDQIRIEAGLPEKSPRIVTRKKFPIVAPVRSVIRSSRD